MSHTTDGSLQALLDGQLDSATASTVRQHVDACDVCAADLAALTRAGGLASRSLAELDADVMAPMLAARAAIAAERRAAGPNGSSSRQADEGRSQRFARIGAGGFARAAMLLLALAGAGAAAIPDSPVRRALDATITRVAGLFSTEPAETVVPEVPAIETPEPAVASEWAAIPASDGRVRVQLHVPTGAVDVTVRLIDGPRANVETFMDEGEVRFVSGTGRLEVIGLGAGRVSIEIPRGLPSAAIQVGGLVHVYKDGDQLRLTGPAGDGQGSEVRFRIGS